MPTLALPSDPSMVQLRKQARELQHRLRSGDEDALALLTEHYPGGESGTVPLHIAQLVIARQYRFPSWPAMTRQVKALQQLSRAPDVDDPAAGPVEEFLRHAVLRYGPSDGPARWASARAMLAADPSIGTADIFTASATSDHLAVQRFLHRDPSLAGKRGGPFNWEPLLYLAYARHQVEVPVTDVLATGRLLLGAGADPNAGYLWHGLSTAFTVLTGTFGSGEQGPVNQPPHPHASALARLLLEAGADPNDGQALYNRMFEPDNGHLELLFEFGLGSGDGGPWHRLLPDLTDSPAQMLRSQLSWAVSHGMAERVQLLAGHGVDLVSPLDGRLPGTRGRTPAELAVISGHPQLVRLLEDLGAPAAELDSRTRLVGALLSGAADQVAALVAADAELLRRVRRRHPALVLRAAAAGSAPGIKLLLENGFDINALGRHDVPVDQEWETALHYAAQQGDVELAELLLAAGADPNIRDRRFDSTPLGWAEHCVQPALIELLQPITGAPAT